MDRIGSGRGQRGSSPVASDMQERAASINAGEMGHVDRSFARMRACMRRSCG